MEDAAGRLGCPKRTVFGPCGGVRDDGRCELAEHPCVSTSGSSSGPTHPPPLPEGNEFPSEPGLLELLAGAGFRLEESGEADLLDSPPEWKERAEAVEHEVERRHGDDPAFRQAEEQSGRVGRLLADGALRPWLGIARNAPDTQPH
jgi:hypothetical protein